MQFRYLLFLALASLALGEKILQASSLVTCMANSSLTADFFDVKLFPDNQTLTYNIHAKTDIEGKVNAELQIWAYGINFKSIYINPCDGDTALKTMCPLYPGNIQLESVATLSKKDLDQVPGIGFTFPDLDLMIVANVFREDTGKKVACVVIQFSNGKTVEHTAVKWVTAVISGLGLLVAAIAATFGNSITAAHIAANSQSLFVYFQTTVIFTMMSVNRVPPMAAAWGQNVAWSVGLVYIKFMQKIFRWYVQSTGGDPTLYLSHKTTPVLLQRSWEHNVISDAAARFPVLGKVGRSLLKASQAAVNDIYGSAVHRVDYHPSGIRTRDLPWDSLIPRAITDAATQHGAVDQGGNPSISPQTSSTLLVLRGMLRVIYGAGIEQTSGAVTSFTFFVLFCLIVCIVFGILKLFHFGKHKHVKTVEDDVPHGSTLPSSQLKTALKRTLLIFTPQLLVFSLWEFYERDSAAVIVIAVFFLILLLSVIGYGSFKVYLTARQSIREHNTVQYLLFGDQHVLEKYGYLYLHFNANHYYYVIVQLAYTFIKSLFIAYAQGSGKTQAMTIFIIELIYFACLCWRKPYMDKRTNVLNITIALVNLLNAFFFTFFSRIYNQPPAVASIMGVIFFVLNCAFSLFLLIFTIVTCLIAIFSKNPDTRYHPAKDDRVYFLRNNEKNAEEEFDALGHQIKQGHTVEHEAYDSSYDLTMRNSISSAAHEIKPTMESRFV